MNTIARAVDRCLRLLECMANLDRPPTPTERQAAYEALHDIGWNGDNEQHRPNPNN